jgi:betaine-aldehyde dehydrogenase
VVTGERETGKMLIDHATPAMVSLTGSVRAGMQVAESASKSLKRVHLELGGKAPVVVFADADLKSAAETIAITGFFNAGQDCTAATRVIVEESAYEEFVQLIAEQAKGLKTGAPSEDDALFGPVNNANQLARVTGFLNEVPAHARVVAGGKQVARDGFFIEPTVIADLKQTDRHIQEEIFGPVITIQKFKDEAEAIRMANGVEYGLASSIWTSNHGRAMRLSRAFDFGCVWINCHIPVVAEMPHGGYKRSGYGKDLSSYGFEDYTRIKHVMTNLNA